MVSADEDVVAVLATGPAKASAAGTVCFSASWKRRAAPPQFAQDWLSAPRMGSRMRGPHRLAQPLPPPGQSSLAGGGGSRYVERPLAHLHADVAALVYDILRHVDNTGDCELKIMGDAVALRRVSMVC